MEKRRTGCHFDKYSDVSLSLGSFLFHSDAGDNGSAVCIRSSVCDASGTVFRSDIRLGKRCPGDSHEYSDDRSFRLSVSADTKEGEKDFAPDRTLHLPAEHRD